MPSPTVRTSIPRLRSVRFKNGGEIRLLPSPREELSWRLATELLDAGAELIETHAGKLAGFAVVVWTADGDAGGHLRNTRFATVPPSALPTFTADVVRRILVADQLAAALGEDSELEGA